MTTSSRTLQRDDVFYIQNDGVKKYYRVVDFPLDGSIVVTPLKVEYLPKNTQIEIANKSAEFEEVVD